MASNIGAIFGAVFGLIGLILLILVIVIPLAELISKRLELKKEKMLKMREKEEQEFKANYSYCKVDRTESFPVPNEGNVIHIERKNQGDEGEGKNEIKQIGEGRKGNEDSKRDLRAGNEVSIGYEMNEEIATRKLKDKAEKKKEPDFFDDTLSKITIKKPNENTLNNYSQDLIKMIAKKEEENVHYIFRSSKKSEGIRLSAFTHMQRGVSHQNIPLHKSKNTDTPIKTKSKSILGIQ